MDVLGRENAGQQCLRVVLDGVQVVFADEALRIELVDVLRAGGTGREPSLRPNPGRADRWQRRHALSAWLEQGSFGHALWRVSAARLRGRPPKQGLRLSPGFPIPASLRMARGRAR